MENQDNRQWRKAISPGEASRLYASGKYDVQYWSFSHQCWYPVEGTFAFFGTEYKLSPKLN